MTPLRFVQAVTLSQLAGGATAAPAKKTIASVTKTSRMVDGLFSLYQEDGDSYLVKVDEQ